MRTFVGAEDLSQPIARERDNQCRSHSTGLKLPNIDEIGQSADLGWDKPQPLPVFRCRVTLAPAQQGRFDQREGD